MIIELYLVTVNWWKFVIPCCCSYSKLLKTTYGLSAKLGEDTSRKGDFIPLFLFLY